jgi:antitoxin component of MazEF toxin-antitoxin module
MEAKFVTKLFRFGSSRAIILPARLLKFLGWSIGDHLAIFIIDDNTIQIERIKVVRSFK